MNVRQRPRFLHLIGLALLVPVLVLLAGCSGESSSDGGHAAGEHHEHHGDHEHGEHHDSGMHDGQSAENGSGSAPATDGPEAMVKLMRAYIAIGERLAADSIERLDPHIKTLKQADDTPVDPKHLEQLSAAEGIAAARKAYAALSTAMIGWVEKAGVPKTLHGDVAKVHCPMVKEEVGDGWWLQSSGDVRNPYMGSRMLKCHDKRQTLPAEASSSGSEDAADHHGHGNHEETTG